MTETAKPFDRINLGASGLNLVGVIGMGFLGAGRLDSLEGKLERFEHRFDAAAVTQKLHEAEGHPRLDDADERIVDDADEVVERVEDLEKTLGEFANRIAFLEACFDDPRSCKVRGRR